MIRHRVRATAVLAATLMNATTVGCGPSRVPVDIVAEEICVEGDNACARMDDGTVLCWGEDGAFVHAGDAVRMQCDGLDVCMESGSGSIDCYAMRDGSAESHPDWLPDPDKLPYADWWMNEWYGAGFGGCGIDDAGRVSCWSQDAANVQGFVDAVSGLVVQQMGFSQPCILVVDDAGRIHSMLLGENCAGFNEFFGFFDDNIPLTYGIEDPPKETGWTAVAGGRYQACALNPAGEVQCWGSALDQPPADLRFTQIDLAQAAACGVTDDTSIACWEVWNLPDEGVPTTTGWRQVEIYSYTDTLEPYETEFRGCALSVEGKVTCFGDWGYWWSSYDDAVLAWMGP